MIGSPVVLFNRFHTIFTPVADVSATLCFRYHVFVALSIQVAQDMVQAIVHTAKTDITVGQHHVMVKMFYTTTGPRAFVMHSIPTLFEIDQFGFE